VVLLPNGNIHSSIEIANSVLRKKTCESVDLLLKAVSYSKYGWKICGDLKVIGLLIGMQSVYTKFCFFCEWDSRAKDKHYTPKDWPMSKNFVPGEQCVRNQPLVDKDKILLLPLPIKLLLMKKTSLKLWTNMVRVLSIWEKNFWNSVMLNQKRVSLLDCKFAKSLMIYLSICWQELKYLHA